MRNIQESILSMLKERSVRKRIAVALCMIAVATVVTVFWVLRISGLTLTEDSQGNSAEVSTLTDASENRATATDGTASSEATTTDGTEEMLLTGITETISLTSVASQISSVSSVLDATSGSSYYFADAVALDKIDTTGDTDYVIYALIGNDYYILDANGRLRKANNFNDGLTVSWEEDGNSEYYKWSVTEDNGLYTVYNETYEQYLSPAYSPATGKDDDATIDTGFSSHTGELTLSGDFELTYTFTNTSNATDTTSNWLNYIIEMQATDTAGTTYLDIRADNYGWVSTPDYLIYSNGDIYISGVLSSDYPSGASNDYVSFGDGTDDWEAWLTSMKAGEKVTVNIVKSGKYVSVNMTAANKTFTAIAYVEEFEDADLTVYITGEACEISDVSYTYYYGTDENAEVSTSVSDSLDDLSLTTAFGSHTTDLSLSGDFVLEYSFTNIGDKNDSGYTYNNFILELCDANYVYLDVRADAGGWLANHNTSLDSITLDGGLTDENDNGSTDDEWSDWLATMKTGVSVSVRVERIGGYVTVATTAVGETFTTSAYVSEYADGRTLYIHLTGEQCDLTDIIYSYYTPVSSRISASDGTAVLTADTSGYAWTATVTLSSSLRSGDYTMTAQVATGYIEWMDSSDSTDYLLCLESSTPQTTVTFCFAQVREYVVWLDGTNGGGTSGILSGVIYYRDAYSSTITTSADENGNLYVVLPDSVDDASYGSYSYTLQGWYDIYSGEYYLPGATAYLTGDTVFYGDWMASTYDVGQAANAVDSVDTSSFIDTELFDYNDLFNLNSLTLDSSTLTSTSHTETWKNVALADTSTAVVSGIASSLDFLFITSNALSGSIANASSRNYRNASYSVNNLNNYDYFPGILRSESREMLGDSALMSALFDTSDGLGKKYIGTANYLFQYDETTGYYYYDSQKNAASYNASAKRFYVYNYTVKGESSYNESETYGSDFFPFNYVSEASAATALNESYNINYWFGMSTEIGFYLPDDSDATSGSGSKNQSTMGSDMVFKFSGDDDVWVYVDDVLVLDMGGMHGAVYGEINFSTGYAFVASNGAENTADTSDFVRIAADGASGTITGSTYSFENGNHTLTIYYLERGSSQSNAAIYFNISRANYSVTLTKQDVNDATNLLAGTTFTVYETYDPDDSGNNVEAMLQTTFTGERDTSEFTTGSDGTVTIYGLLPGETYYVVETVEPDGYAANGQYFTLYMDGSGILTVKVYNSGGVVASYSYDYSSSGSELTVLTAPSSTVPWDYVLSDSITVSYTSVSQGGGTAYYTAAMTVQNTTAYELAATGGVGTFTFRNTGIALMLASVTGLLFIAFYNLVRIRKLRTDGNRKGSTNEGKHLRRFAGTRDRPEQRCMTHARDAPVACHGNGARIQATGPGM